MSRSKFYTSLAACLLILSPILQAEPSKPASLPATAEASTAEECNSASAKASANAKAKASVDMDSPLLLKEQYPRWTQMDAQEAPALMQALIEQIDEQLSEIAQLKAEEMNDENTFSTMENIYIAAQRLYRGILHLSESRDSPKLRKVKGEITEMLIDSSAKFIKNEALLMNLKRAASQDWVSALSPAKKRQIQIQLDAFKDHGAELEASQKIRCQEILQKIHKKQFQFEQNLKDSSNPSFIIRDPTKLAGMSEAWMKNADISSHKNPKWIIRNYYEILIHCDHEATRRKCWLAERQFGKINESLVYQIAELRHELAQLLGFDNFADFTTKRRMIATEPNMRRFIMARVAQIKPTFDKETKDLLAFISEKKAEKVTQIAPWDLHYYLKLLKEERFPFDEEKLRDYFPHEQVVQGMFSIFERVFDIRIDEKASYCPKYGEKIPANKVEVWNSEIKVFELFDASSNKYLGSFYLDIFARYKKRSGAWAISLRSGNATLNDNSTSSHLAALSCNFPSPVDGKQSLLSHDQVKILFHEMGHILHIMFSQTDSPMYSSMSVAMDFVEFPSQLAEQWIWTNQGLDIIARQHKTGAKIPDDIKKQILKNKYFMSSIIQMEELSIALLDLELHSRYDKLFKGKDLDEATDIILKDMRLPFTQPYPISIRKFAHSMSAAYASSFYSYQWGELLAVDAFSRFLKDGILNPNTGKHLRASILSKGNSAPAMELFKNFMGREPNRDALLEQQGLLPVKEKK